MNKELNVMADSMQHSRKGWKRWQRIVSSLACMVVFVTTYALILPAITKERETYCGMELHEHSEECYSEGLTCTLSEEGHAHSDECYEVIKELTCEEEEEHTESCYTVTRNLICTLEEQEPHAHNEACYGKLLSCGKEEHAHTLRCYSSNQQELVAAIAREEQEAGHGAEFYHARYGTQEADWTALFAAYVLDQAGVDKEALSYHPYAEQWLDALYNAEDPRLQSPKAHAPADGDIVFLEEDEVITVAVVAKADNDSLTLVGADIEGAVLADSKLEKAPIAYVLTLEAPEAPETSEEKTVPEEEADPVALEDESDEEAVYLADDSSEGFELGTAEDRGSVSITPFYRCPADPVDPNDPEASWKPMTSGVEVHANDYFKIKGSYKNININTIKENNYKLLYDVEEFLTDITANGIIDVNGEKRGDIYFENGHVVLEFNKRWIDSFDKAGNNGEISGKFEYEGSLDLSWVEDHKGQGLTLGDVTMGVPDWQSARAQFAGVNIDKGSQKKLIHDEASDRYFLQYTVTVTAGRYGAPDVAVIDTLSANADFLEGRGYVGIGTDDHPPVETVNPSGAPGELYMTSVDPTAEKSGKPAADPNGSNLAWYIGDMGPGEVRTLTYYVELTHDFVGIPHNNDDTISNDAYLFSKDYPRGTEGTTYAPDVNATIVKDRVSMQKGDDGLWHVKFRTRVTANANNSYPLENLKIEDYANNGQGFSQYRHCVKLVEGSIVIYAADGVTPIEDIDQFVAFKSDTNKNPVVLDEKNPRDFNLYIGTLAPGESRVVEYEMTMDAEAAKPYVNGNVTLFNTADLYTDDERQDRYITRDTESVGVDSQIWTRKMQGEQSRFDQTIQMNTNGDNKVVMVNGTDDPTREFIVPAGSYAYSVVVNEKGDWDVSTANMEDNLTENDSDDNPILLYTGYVQIDVYNQVDGMNSDAAVKNYLQSHTPKQTIWVNVDNLRDFSFKANDLGVVPGEIDPETGNQLGNAYILTYYSKINPDAANFRKVNAGNSFGLSGKVGPGDGITVGFPSVTVSSTIIETGTEDPHKDAWYYDPDDICFNDPANPADKRYPAFETGAMYWAVTFTGEKVPKGMSIQDSTRLGGNTWHWNGGDSVKDTLPYTISRYDASWIGFYSGILRDEEGNPVEIYDYFDNIDEALNSGLLHEVDPKYYTLKWGQGSANYPDTNPGAFGVDKNGQTYWDITVTMDQAYGLQSGERLYALFRTQPTKLPSNESITYQNKINYKEKDGVSWQDPFDTDRFKLTDKNGGLEKEVGGIYEISHNGNDAVVIDKVTGESIVKVNRWDKNGPGGDEARHGAFRLNVQKGEYAKSTANYDLTVNDSNDDTTGDGVYISWLVSANTKGALDGDFTIVDTLPEGVKLSYVRTYSAGGVSYGWGNKKQSNYLEELYAGPGVASITNRPNMNDNGPNFIFGWENQEYVSDGWTENIVHAHPADLNVDRNVTTTYYYTKDNQIKIDTKLMRSREPIVYQVVCKVDPEYVNIFEDTEYNNQAKLLDSTGKQIDERGATAILFGDTANKAALVEGLVSGNVTTTKFPYEIEVNMSGSDMVPESDVITIPLVDRMSGNLSLANDTLMIFKAPAYETGPNGLPLDADGNEVPKSSSNIAYNLDNLLYYGGVYTNDPEDHFYNPDKVGQTVGYIPKVPASKEIVVSVETAVNSHGEPVLFNGKTQTDVKFSNLPDSTPIVICYKVNAIFDGSDGTSFSNKAFWDGYEKNEHGEVENERVYYKAKGNALLNFHGALVINKFDSKNMSKPLAGAKFALYRIEYHDHSDGYLLWEDDVPENAEIRSKRNLAVYLGPDKTGYHEIGSHVELRVKRDVNGAITKIQVPIDKNRTTPSTDVNDPAFQWLTLNEALSKERGYEFHHEPVLDTDGNVQVYWDEVLSRGITDASGKLSYGLSNPYGKLLGDDNETPMDHDHEDAYGHEDRIHFNKIYAIVETEAPAGYVLDPTPHFFVLPKSTEDMLEYGDLTSGSYFYHENWPTGVAVINDKKNEIPRYDYDFRNEKAPLSITKNIVGGTEGFQANVPYTFGVWPGEGEVTKDNVLHTVTITYRAEDFGTIYTETSIAEGKTLVHYYYQNGDTWYHRAYDGSKQVSYNALNSEQDIPSTAVKSYGIKPGHQRTVNFPEMDYGTYRIYEMNDAGYPINYKTGTINGVEYTVTTGGDANDSGVIHYGAEKNKVEVTNATYRIGVTKQFYSPRTDSHAPIVGEYSFGIWDKKNVTTTSFNGSDPYIRVSANQADMIDSVTISWERDEVNNPEMQTKTEWFTDLEPGTQYYIFELDENGDPVPYDYQIGENESKTPLRHLAALESNNFHVLYPQGNTSATPAANMGGDSEVIVVENQPQYVNLPRTGGIGTQVYTQAGTILILLGLGYYGWLLWHRRERRKW